MIRRNKKTKIYHAPSAKVTQMALESNFCETAIYNAQVDQLYYLNSDVDDKGHASEILDIEF